MKKIVYTILDNGVDGRDKTTVVNAFWFEKERDKAFDGDKNKAYYRKGEEIVDPETREKAALAKLDGIDRLILKL